MAGPARVDEVLAEIARRRPCVSHRLSALVRCGLSLVFEFLEDLRHPVTMDCDHERFELHVVVPVEVVAFVIAEPRRTVGVFDQEPIVAVDLCDPDQVNGVVVGAALVDEAEFA